VIVPPSILAPPQNQTVVSGESALFNVIVNGTEPFVYKWLFNGTGRAGATNAMLILTGVGPSQAGDYSLVVSNPAGSVTSTVARLTVILSPAISTQPQDQTIVLGGSASLSVRAGGTPPLVYQWQRNGMNIAGATQPTLVFTNVQPADGGSYSVVVANAVGVAASEVARLTVPVDELPLMDNFLSRPLVTAASGVGRATNRDATREPGEPEHSGKQGGHSLWLAWRAPAAGVATFATTGSDFDTLLAVYIGTSVSRLTPIVSDEDQGGFLTSRVAFTAVAGME